MNKRPSEIIREKILRNGGRVIVHSITGKPYEIRHCSDGKSFLCDQLPIKPPYTYDVFDVIVDLLVRQGGRADKGAGRNAKLGQPNDSNDLIYDISNRQWSAEQYAFKFFSDTDTSAAKDLIQQTINLKNKT